MLKLIIKGLIIKVSLFFAYIFHNKKKKSNRKSIKSFITLTQFYIPKEIS